MKILVQKPNQWRPLNKPTASQLKGNSATVSVLSMILNSLEPWGKWSTPLLVFIPGPQHLIGSPSMSIIKLFGI